MLQHGKSESKGNVAAMAGDTLRANYLVKFQPVAPVDRKQHISDRLWRACDIVIAVAALVALAPLMLSIAILTYIMDPGPILFGHVRIGYRGVPFRCLKFRSMVVNAEERLIELLQSDPEALAEWRQDHKLRNDPRITQLGRFLRASSLDELPQLFNVIRGEMSLVGPRPIVEKEIHRYGRYFANYCSCRPGVTGLWQVSGRNDVSYRRRVALDVIFSRTRSLYLYFGLLAVTVPSMLRSRGY